ncbi:MAG: delta-60 repeat domain-containing protein [Ferruginibacter sp.]
MKSPFAFFSTPVNMICARLIFIISISVPATLYAQLPGSIDLTFSNPPVNLGDSSRFVNDVNDIVKQPDGKYIVTGYFTYYNGTPSNRIVRLNADQTLDTSFKVGYTTTGGFNYEVKSVALQPDGKILAAGVFTSYNGTPCNHIARLNIDGSIDTTFNTGTGFNNTTRDIIVQPDNRILVCGEFYQFNGVARQGIARLDTSGSLDNAFNIDTYFSGAIYKMALQVNGKIVIGGSFQSNYGIGLEHRNSIARLNTNGSIDNNFPSLANNATFGLQGGVFALAIQPDGKILAGGDFKFNPQAEPYRMIARFNTDGTFDNTFIVGDGFDNYDHDYAAVNDIKVQPDGKIIVGGYFNLFKGDTSSGISRLHPNGTRDTGFKTGTGFYQGFKTVNTITLDTTLDEIIVGGVFSSYNNIKRNKIAVLDTNGHITPAFHVNTGFEPLSSVKTIALQPDGQIIAGGQFENYGDVYSYNLIRVDKAGTIDTAFVSKVGYTGYISDAYINCIALQPDGKIIVGGKFQGFNDSIQPHLLRLNYDGTLDTTFKTGTGFSGFGAEIFAVVKQPDGKIIAAGTFTSFSGISSINIVRMNTDGSPDLGFNTGTGANRDVFDVLLQPDGKIIARGNFTKFNNVTCKGIVRLNDDGSLDNTFAINVNVGNYFGAFKSNMLLQADGKILVCNGGVVRLNADGSLDNTFSAGFPTGYLNSIYSISQQADGKIVAAGNFGAIFVFADNQNYDNNSIVRFDSNGSLDTSFNSGIRTTDISIRKVLIDSTGQILAGGNFSKYDGHSIINLMRINSGDQAESAAVTSIANGNWNDATIWSGGVVPAPGDNVIVKHSVTLNANSEVYSLSVQKPNGNLIIQTGANLKIIH